VDVFKLPILSSSRDWMRWNRAVFKLIGNLGLFEHICLLPAPGSPATWTIVPSFLPELSKILTLTELEAGGMTMAPFGTSSDTLGLGPSSVIPERRDHHGNFVVSTRQFSSVLYRLYGGGDHNTAAIIKDSTTALICGSEQDAVQTYITTRCNTLQHLSGTP